jgi:hypothetical protein
LLLLACDDALLDKTREHCVELQAEAAVMVALRLRSVFGVGPRRLRWDGGDRGQIGRWYSRECSGPHERGAEDRGRKEDGDALRQACHVVPPEMFSGETTRVPRP